MKLEGVGLYANFRWRQDPNALIGAMEASFQPLIREFSWIMNASNNMAAITCRNFR